MGNVFSLDSFREEAEKEFAPLKIALSDGTEVTLRNLVRLGKKNREKVLELLKKLQPEKDEEGEDKGTTLEELDELVEAIEQILVIIGGDNGKKLVKDLDGDISVSMRVIEAWMESTQPGEANSSPSS